MTTQTQVLIVGGSLNGLSLALFLARRDVHCVVVERHPATTVQYKFAGISPRSMEIFRGAGIERQIREHHTGDQKAGEIVRAANLSDPNPRFLGKPWSDMGDLSAATAETCDQNTLEPILRAAAERLGADVRFHTELTGFTEDDHEVRCDLHELATGRQYSLAADYVVGADGVGGRTRELLGIGRSGPGVLQHWMNLIFDTDLEPFLGGRRFTSCFVTDLNASVTPRPDRWLLSLQYRPELGEKPEDFDRDRTAELVRRAAGRAEVRAELYDARHWDVAAYLADRFAAGRAFLLGDAAHSMPPTGGFGGNTGIHDAHNLAWKLALVLRGAARSTLLASYDAERRFVAQRTLAQSLARLAAWFEDPARRLPPAEPIIADEAVIFGYVYPRGALVAEDEPGAAFEDPRAPSGRPGARAPHFELALGGRRLPIHDLIGDGFVLLAGEKGRGWRAAALHCADRFAARLDCVPLGRDGYADPGGRFEAAYGVESDGAVLVRPDGHIAWRSRREAADPADALGAALHALMLTPNPAGNG